MDDDGGVVVVGKVVIAMQLRATLMKTSLTRSSHPRARLMLITPAMWRLLLLFILNNITRESRSFTLSQSLNCHRGGGMYIDCLIEKLLQKMDE